MFDSANQGEGLLRPAFHRACQRRPGDPLTRLLRIFTFDAARPMHEGAVTTVAIPYEPLDPGPEGALFYVEGNGAFPCEPLDLDHPRVLASRGRSPAASDIQFHDQMVYVVCAKLYARFQQALGRVLCWGFDAREDDGSVKLCLAPHASPMENAAYEKHRGRIAFGYYKAAEGVGRNAPNGTVFTCLSHDIIAHEVTHALLDGLRAHFVIPTGPDVLGFHEGFADLIAVFQHFTYKEVLEAEIRKAGGELHKAYDLANIAENFGLTTNRGGPLRCAIGGDDLRYRPDMEAHEMGSVLLTAVFSAFLNVFQRKTEPYLRLAYRPPSGYLIAELIGFLADKASSIAEQFLTMCIRAIDYCPPVDMTLGDYLRALITADRDLIPDDRWGYRDALIDAFGQHGIYPEGVDTLSEDSLCWLPPLRFLMPVPGLHFGDLRFAGDPALPVDQDEILRQAEALWSYATRPHICEEFGLAAAGADGAGPACIESIRTSRRVGPNGEVLFDLIAEITQRRLIQDESGVEAEFLGGSTVILGPEGEIRYLISKNVMNAGRTLRQLAFQQSSPLWSRKQKQYRLRGYAHQLAHQTR